MEGISLVVIQTAASVIATGITVASGRLMDWLRRSLRPDTVGAAEAVAANPTDDKARETLEELLRREVEACPSLMGELRALLDDAGIKYAPQSANVTAEGSTIIQIQGNKNLA